MTLNQLLYIITILTRVRSIKRRRSSTWPSLTSSLREVESELCIIFSAELKRVSRSMTMGQSFFKTQDICINSMNRWWAYSDGGLKTKFGLTQHYCLRDKGFCRDERNWHECMILLSETKHKECTDDVVAKVWHHLPEWFQSLVISKVRQNAWVCKPSTDCNAYVTLENHPPGKS